MKDCSIGLQNTLTEDRATTTKQVKTEVLSVRKVLEMEYLDLPDYQRPYKWQSEHVGQLLSDLRYHQGSKAYRLGSFVFHDYLNNGQNKSDIVDGQQRLVTLLLIVAAIQKKAPGLIQVESTSLLDRLMFAHEKSRDNIVCNYNQISDALGISELTPDFVEFLLNRCEVVCFTLSEVNEAFQFFDSQNARGRALDPHDLLKAYHLRQFNPADEYLKSETVNQWEAIEENDVTELRRLFSEYLYRIRQWSRGQRAQSFRNRDIAVFKGINPKASDEDYPHLRALKMAHLFVDEYNARYSRNIDQQAVSYPFGLDQTILNGRRFFEMVRHYQKQGFHQGIFTNTSLTGGKLTEDAKNVIETIGKYDGRYRTGDRYVRILFDCLLMYYFDKFGDAELSRAIIKIFIWAYTLRLEFYAVRWATIEKYVKEDKRFMMLRNSCRPADFLDQPCRLPEIKDDIKGIDRVKACFNRLISTERRQ